MTERPLGERSFSMGDQMAFARASGDVNPVHVDATYARRTVFGDVIVHGVHGLLWGLECLVERGEPLPSSARTQFAKPIFLGDTVTVALERDGGSKRLTIAADGVPLTTVSLDAPVAPVAEVPASPAGWATTPRPLARPEIAGRRATLPFDADQAELKKLFPELTAAAGERAVGSLALLSRLVGMECPGQQSIFGGVAFQVSRNSATHLSYQVRRSEPPVAPIDMTFRGPDVSGTISAFFRPLPVEQPSAAALRDRVTRNEFMNQHALVIGGSRGLGELTAKLLAAGGADVTITFASGSTDADRVCREIRAAGGRCRTARFDVLDPAATLPAIDFERPLIAAYYFATPRIGGRRSKALQHDSRFYTRFYVDAFEAFCRSLRRVAPSVPVILYPSTVFIEEENRDFAEYARAKAAGEVLAAQLTEAGVARVVAKRLPRMATDQTAGVVAPTVADSVAVMLEALREMSTSASSS